MGEPRGPGRLEDCETDAGKALPVYNMDKPACTPVAVTAPPVDPGDLEALLRCLLPSALMPTPPTRLMPTDMECLLECLLSGMSGPTPKPPPQTKIMGVETRLLRFLPGTPVPASWRRLGPARRDWTTIVCFSRGKLGHGVGRCPALEEHWIPVYATGMVGGKGGRQLHDDLATGRS